MIIFIFTVSAQNVVISALPFHVFAEVKYFSCYSVSLTTNWLWEHWLSGIFHLYQPINENLKSRGIRNTLQSLWCWIVCLPLQFHCLFFLQCIVSERGGGGGSADLLEYRVTKSPNICIGMKNAILVGHLNCIAIFNEEVLLLNYGITT